MEIDLGGLAPSCGPVAVVAVDGHSAAGKSALAARLAHLNDAPVLGLDEFPVAWDADPLSWWPMASELLESLRKGDAASFRPYDWRGDEYLAERTIPVTPLLILDGVGAGWRGSPASLRIWVEAPFDLRRRRALARDDPALLPLWETWVARETEHFIRDRTRQRADVIVENSYEPDGVTTFDPARPLTAMTVHGPRGR